MQRRLPDRLGPNLRVLFVGINPGLRSAALGHHFAGFSNRFWKLLVDSGLVPEPITYLDDVRLPEWGYGLTNLVTRPTAGIDELGKAEYVAGRRTLTRKVATVKPKVVALVGVTVYRAMFDAAVLGPAKSLVGLQPVNLATAVVYVLPNPSGRNAHYSYADMLRCYRGLRDYLEHVSSRDW